MKPRLLVVDDEESVREVVRAALEDVFEISEAEDPDSGLVTLLDSVPQVLIADVVMPRGGGQRLVERAFEYLPDLAVVVITGHADTARFVEFFRLGVADFLPKPFTLDELRRSVEKALVTRRARRESAQLREAGGVREGSSKGFVGGSEAVQRVRQMVASVAPSDSTVLITGESGTGKEVVARLLHETSPRRDAAFVPVHCGALPSGLVESELFGHVRGAFTGADWPREGCFEAASGGTLFLDEIGTMPEGVQTRLLRVLQERRVCRVGETAEREVDVRVVAATNEDPGELVARRRLREDLLYRLEVFPIALPPLRERDGDVLLLANSFLDEFAGAPRPRRLVLSGEASRALLSHSWPGNVRELRNVIERACLLAEGAEIGPNELLLAPAGRERAWPLPASGLDLSAFLSAVELDLMAKALERSGGSKAQAAALLRLPRPTFVRRWQHLSEGDRSGGHALGGPG